VGLVSLNCGLSRATHPEKTLTNGTTKIAKILLSLDHAARSLRDRINLVNNILPPRRSDRSLLHHSGELVTVRVKHRITRNRGDARYMFFVDPESYGEDIETAEYSYN